MNELQSYTLKPADPFWLSVDTSGGPDACWEWQATRDQAGYGRYRGRGAHRIAYELAVGMVPSGYVVLHACDNPSCCNPAHLQAGTHSANMCERVLKGRGGYRPSTLLRRLQADVARLELRKKEATGSHTCPYCRFSKLTLLEFIATERWLSCWACRKESQLAARHNQIVA